MASKANRVTISLNQVLIVLFSALALSIINMGCNSRQQQLTAADRPIRLLDQEDFWQSSSDNISHSHEVRGMPLNGQSWQAAGQTAQTTDQTATTGRMYTYELSSGKMPAASQSPELTTLEIEGTKVRFAATSGEAMASRESVWFFSQMIPLIPSPLKITGRNRHLTYDVDLPLARVLIEVEINVHVLGEGSDNPSPQCLVKLSLDGRSVGQAAIHPSNRPESLQFWVEDSPGRHSLRIDLEASHQGSMMFIVKSIRAGVEEGMLILKATGNLDPRAATEAHLSYLYVDDFTKAVIDQILASENTGGFQYRKRTLPVVSVAYDTSSIITQRSVVWLAPADISSTVTLPEDAVMAFAYCRPRRFKSFAPRFRLVARDPSSKAVLLDREIRLNRGDSSYRQTAEIDLASLGNRRVTLSFHFTSAVGDDAIVVSEPVIRARHQKGTTLPNIILISLDTLRADHVGTYGYERDTTPATDRIAAEGTLFINALAQSSWTLPSHMSMLTGVCPLLLDYLSGSEDELSSKVPVGVPTIATYLKRAGYYNVAFTGGGYVSAEYGFDRDFDLYWDDRTPEKIVKRTEGNRIVKNTGFDRAYTWLESNHEYGPFFMFLHTYAIHSSYAAPPFYDNLFPDTDSIDIATSQLQRLNRNASSGGPSERKLSSIVAAYDRGIRWTDDGLAILYSKLKSLGLMDRTVIIVTSDHGEELLDHGQFLHHTNYEECLRVPLIVRFPEVFPAGLRVESRVGLSDIMPTILEMLDIEPDVEMDGSSLLPLLREDQAQPEKVTYSYRRGWHTVTSGRFKYHLRYSQRSPPSWITQELYDLDADPGETENLFEDKAQSDDTRASMAYRMLHHIAESRPGLNLLLQGFETNIHVSLKGQTGTGGVLPAEWPGVVDLKTNNLTSYHNRTGVTAPANPGLWTFDLRFGTEFTLEVSSTNLEARGDKPVQLTVLGETGPFASASPVTLSLEQLRTSTWRSFDEGPSGKTYNAILWYTKNRFSRDGPQEVVSLSEAELSQLKALGYLDSDSQQLPAE